MDNIKEIWKDIPGYEWFYQVSNLGRVKSLARKTNNQFGKTDMIMSPGWVHKKGSYEFVQLCKNGTSGRYLVHRLVAEAFLPNPDNLPQVNHKDENPNNNCVDNLEWCDCIYNINYGNRTKKVSKSLGIEVKQFDKAGNFIKSYPSAVEAEKETGISSQNISRCRSGSLPSAGGFVWTY